MIDTDAIKARFERLSPFLDERARRLFAANEALTAGWGGITAVSQATGVARSTIGRGLVELRSENARLTGRIRRPGGGSKPKTETEPGLLAALEDLVQSAIRGDPEAALLWVSRSQRHLAGALAERGFTASQKLVGRLLRKLGFSLQANRKTREGASHPDRDAQFEHINKKIKQFQATRQPAISVDTKKKELVGDFKNGGRELRPKGEPEPVRVHDFKIPELGKVAPYGVYDITDNSGWVNVGIDHDTAAFAVESIRRWWNALGKNRYLGSTSLLITADCGGSNGARVRLWKRELQTFANETGLSITVAHHPPGTSKWNRIEHRLFAFITQNWRGKPLVSREVIVQLIGATTTDKGLDVQCCLDENDYPRAIKVTDAEMAAINIKLDSFHGEWNYTISPQPCASTEQGSSVPGANPVNQDPPRPVGRADGNRSIFYAESGGQPGDSGELRWDGGSARVVDTRKGEGPACNQALKMIDDPEKTALFIARLKELLPIAAGIAKDLQHSLAAKSPEMPIPARCQVVDVLNLGDEGGVACCLDIGGPDTAAVHIVSITHLLFDRRSPLFRDINAYQRRRIKKLKRQRGRGF